MSRGGSYGGGQSSLGYLFGSDDQKQSPPPPTAKPVIPPYGIDRFDSSTEFKPPDTPTNSSEKQKNSNNYHRAQGQNSWNFLTDRPTTKVKSAPGGDSSLGYLFGAKLYNGCFFVYVLLTLSIRLKKTDNPIKKVENSTKIVL